MKNETLDQSLARIEVLQTLAVAEAGTTYEGEYLPDRQAFASAFASLLETSTAFRGRFQSVLNVAPNVHSHYIYIMLPTDTIVRRQL
jgi:hypothetical protein